MASPETSVRKAIQDSADILDSAARLEGQGILEKQGSREPAGTAVREYLDTAVIQHLDTPGHQGTVDTRLIVVFPALAAVPASAEAECLVRAGIAATAALRASQEPKDPADTPGTAVSTDWTETAVTAEFPGSQENLGRQDTQGILEGQVILA